MAGSRSMPYSNAEIPFALVVMIAVPVDPKLLTEPSVVTAKPHPYKHSPCRIGFDLNFLIDRHGKLLCIANP